ncbi:hypothetical protein A6X20_41160 [Bradyrhizobium elkanii]|nr:hypothetical protein A6X20_41160 [Bradyrhizobium elkanii]
MESVSSCRGSLVSTVDESVWEHSRSTDLPHINVRFFMKYPGLLMAELDLDRAPWLDPLK